MREFMDFNTSYTSGRSAGRAAGEASKDFSLSHFVANDLVSTNAGFASINASNGDTAATISFSKPSTDSSHDGDAWRDYGEVNLKAIAAHSTLADVGADLNLLSTPSSTLTSGGSSLAVPGTVQNIPPAFSVTGFIAPDTDDTDVYSVDLTAGETYTFSLFGFGVDPLSDTLVELFDGNGNFINFDDDGGTGVNSLLTFTADTSGTYFIRAGAFPGSGLGGSYRLDGIIQPATDVVPSGPEDGFDGLPTLNFGPDNYTYGFIEDGSGPYGGLGETDTYAVTVQAGNFYTFEIAGGSDYNTDYLDVPTGELDTVAILYDANGAIIASNDDISFPDDISSKISFFAEEDGVVYLDVTAYAGQTGGYAIQSDRQSLEDLDPLDAFDWVSADNISFDKSATAYVYFGDSDQNFGQTGDDGNPMVTIDWNDFEKQQVMEALGEYERILGVNYEITENEDQATFRLLKTESQQYGAYFFPQDPIYGGSQGVGVFNVLSGGWNFDQQQSLEQGGFAFAVVLHEFGHAHGLSHPHDQGGGSDILAGVAGANGFGVFDLNQGVYSVMSYNDAWETPFGPSPFTAAGIDNGWSGTLAAFDIGTLQRRYGINSLTAGGNNDYVLSDVQAQGTYYETIHDIGGTDSISYNGTRDARIDLTSATLEYTPVGGGVVSYVDGIFGGYTIDNTSTIERAYGGAGNDTLVGNGVDNTLVGNGGNDLLIGRNGRDVLDGGDGSDTVSYEQAPGAIFARLNDGRVLEADGSRDVLISVENLVGSRFADNVFGSNRANIVDGLAGDDMIRLLGGDDIGKGSGGNDVLKGNAGNDTLDGGQGSDRLLGGTGDDTFSFSHIEKGDRIGDFESGSDQIDLTNTGVDFTFVGDAAFTGTAGELRFDNGRLQGDVDGDGLADLVIRVNGDDVLASDLVI